MKITFKCPYVGCEIENDGVAVSVEGSVQIDLNNPKPKMVTCDEEEGGCGRRFIVWIEDIEYETKVQALDCELEVM